MRSTRQTSSSSRTTSQRPRATATPSSAAVGPEPATLPSTDVLASRIATRLAIGKGKEATTAGSKGTAQAPTRPRTRRAGAEAVAEVEVENLARIVEQKLTIGPTTAKSREEICEGAMRAVNAASKSLSAIVETGRKSSGGGDPSSSRKSSSSQDGVIAADVERHSKTIREGLCTLRAYKPGDMDVERAACSAAGKLISLESYQSAIPILQDISLPLRSLYCPKPLSAADVTNPPICDELDILSLPLPHQAMSKGDETLLTLVTTYLMYALTATAWTRFARMTQQDSADSLTSFANALHNSSTLLQWLPLMRNFASKHLDSALTRAYTALTKSSALHHPLHITDATDVYRIRLYSLFLLLGTSPSGLKPRMFWEQAVKFTVAFVKCVANSEQKQPPSLEIKDHTTSTVLHSFDQILIHTNARNDKAEWTSGPAFVAFCEYWVDFARRAERLDTLKKVSQLIRSATSASPRQMSGNSATDIPVERQSDSTSLPTALQAASICAILTQATVLLEKLESIGDDWSSVREAAKMATRTEPFVILAFSATHDDDAALRKASSKVWRAVERLRRTALKASEALLQSVSTDGHQEALDLVTRAILDVLSRVLVSVETGHAELLTSTLDSLFSLAKTTLDCAKSSSFTHALEHISQALVLVNGVSEASLNVMERANFLRCISGAFHNLGATIYQAGHYSHAIRFFEKSCPVGEEAVKAYLVGYKAGAGHAASEREEQWTSLEDQLCRRWEILGVCYSKIGDRKSAFSAFRSSVLAFPFSKEEFEQRTGTCTDVTLFEDSPSAKHISTVLDRMTYLGVCELLLPIKEISVRSHFRNKPVQDAVLGAMLERQAEGLSSSKWKPAVHNAIGSLLQDALVVYSRQSMPIRSARVMLKQLEHASSSNGKGACLVDNPEQLVKKADALLQTDDLGLDAGLAGFCPQYRAQLKLRMAQWMHQHMEPLNTSHIVACVEDACSILKPVSLPVPRQSLVKPTSPLITKIQSARKAAGKRTVTTSRATSTRARARTAKVASAQPVTPRPRKSAASNHIPPLPRLSFGRPAKFEYAPALMDLLHTTAHMLGLLGQVVMKVKVLLIGRRISEQHIQSKPDDYVQFSTELAHEYVNLGKTGKAANVYSASWNTMNNLRITEETRAMFLLRYSESLVATGNILKSSASYTEAFSIAQALDTDERSLPSAQRILNRASLVERAAVASTTYSLIQYTRDDPVASINGMLQSLRLWNRAFDTLSRLTPSPPPKAAEGDSDNPFLQESEPQRAPPRGNDNIRGVEQLLTQTPSLSGIGWRIAEGLLNTLFSLTRAYVSRGSPREAEFFARQAQDLAIALNMPAMISRALCRLGEIYLHLGQLNDSHACLAEAARLISDASGPDAAEIRRLHADHSRVSASKGDARQLYDEAISLLEELEQQFMNIDGHAVSPRKSEALSPKSTPTSSNTDTLAPSLLLSILRQNIWMLHAEGNEYHQLLERLRALPSTAETKAEESALIAKLKLDDVYGRFQADMFLSSLTESAITLPMGMKKQKTAISSSTQEILTMLSHAEKLFWSDLALVAKRGNVFHVRDAALSLSLIKAFQDTLGKASVKGPNLATCLLDKSTAITLRREVLEVVQFKFRDHESFNDLQWPLITSNGSPMPQSQPRKQARFVSPEWDDEEASSPGKDTLKEYWKSLADKYHSQTYDASQLSGSPAKTLPPNWFVVSISVSEDKNTMFVTRQCASKEPLIFYIPLKERREMDDEDYLSFDNALAELREIIHLSDEGTKGAVNVRNDRDARAAWWANRSALDKRMKQLLENIEFCWLGAFKTILSSPRSMPSDALQDLRVRIERLFDRGVMSRDKKQKASVQLDDALLECFACLSPKARDEELEDLIYFILDLYQFHGIPVATAEIDVDQVVIDFRTILEDYAARHGARAVEQDDSHLFLVLDKNVQGFPWESIPILRGKSVSRIPSMDFLLDRVQYAKDIHGKHGGTAVDRLVVDPRETFFILNPSGDLKNTEARFVDWLRGMKKVGWNGIIGKAPSELQFADALTRKDLVIYFGHGGAEQYIRSRKVRHLPRCAATMLWGCSSGELKDMGDFDRTGTPYNYMLAGCPTLVANLWDVTDRDIDKFSQSVFDKMCLTPDAVQAWGRDRVHERTQTSIVAAVAQSRDACKLKYLTGAAPIVYGIPFYL